nr:formin-like protein 14 [Manis javanica]
MVLPRGPSGRRLHPPPPPRTRLPPRAPSQRPPRPRPPPPDPWVPAAAGPLSPGAPPGVGVGALRVRGVGRGLAERRCAPGTRPGIASAGHSLRPGAELHSVPASSRLCSRPRVGLQKKIPGSPSYSRAPRAWPPGGPELSLEALTRRALRSAPVPPKPPAGLVPSIHRAMFALPFRQLLSVGAARSVSTPGWLPWVLPATSRLQPSAVLVTPPATSTLPALPSLLSHHVFSENFSNFSPDSVPSSKIVLPLAYLS